MNSTNWLFCMKCLEKGNKVWMVKGNCPVCNYSKKKIAKLTPKAIQTTKYNFVNDMLFYKHYYPLLLEFMSIITTLTKNENYTRNFYLSVFKDQEEQFISSSYSYLKKFHYYMSHYDKVNYSKKKTCSLNEIDIMNITINDNEYKKIIIDALHKKVTFRDAEKVMEILDRYNYPKEYAIEKTFMDIMKVSMKSKITKI